ncbi:MAG: polymer-forming cytoskeletal protein [Chromatiales bacterium]|jgi:cytoskeletal protein CcmA (bactofilin family)|nr:MAG: polymer-forming cytoskeletal protein [Chromatiales bacterium]
MFDRTKKNPGDTAQDSPPTSPYQSQTSAPAADATHRPVPVSTAPAAVRGRATAVIGPSIQIEGTLRGQEDVSIEGEVTGTIHLQNNTLTVGAQGKIKADVYANTIYVEGSTEGDLFGSEQVIIRKSAKVRGNITSPRVSLEDGATFKGSIEMDPESVKSVLGPAGASSRNVAPARPASAPQPVSGSTAATPISNAGGGQSR